MQAVRSGHRCAVVAASLAAALAGLGSAAHAAPAAYRPGRVIVKYAAEGSHALEECAEALTRSGRAFRRYTADRSDSLDRLHRRLGVRRVRALFRHPDGTSFREQRRRLAARFSAASHGRRAARPGAPPPDLSHVYLVSLPATADVEDAVARYRADPHVVYAQPDYRVEPSLVPDDPFFHTRGSWGQPYDDLWNLKQIRAAEAWDISQGEGVIVAVVDTGVDYAHPDLAANMWVNPGEDLDGNGVFDEADRNGVDDDGNGYVDDVHGFDFAETFDADEDGRFDGPDDVLDPDPFDENGHGTHVAGIVGAVMNNGRGIPGVAPRARIMALKGFGGPNNGVVALSQGIVYAAENGATVINNSWSCSFPCPSNPLAEDAVRAAAALGALSVFSAGNVIQDVAVRSPQNMRETLTVAATNHLDERANFSNFGFLVDVAAPGGGVPAAPPELAPVRNVLSLRSSGTPPEIDGDGAFVIGEEYIRWAGTSMSAPHAAGVAALVRSLRPDFDNDQVRAVLRISARDLGSPGHDPEFGAGRLDAAAALAVDSFPRLDSALTSPSPGFVARVGGDDIVVSGTAAGPDFRAYALSIGAGQIPESFEPLGPMRQEPVVEGELGRWPVAEVEEGRYVLRLEVLADDGSSVFEFVPLFAERNPPRQVSPFGPAAFDPAISGDRVVWHSERRVSDPDEEGEEAEDEGENLFLTDLSDESVYAIAATTADETGPAISGSHVAWQTAVPETVDTPASFGVATCRFERPPDPDDEGGSGGEPDPDFDVCPRVPVAGGPAFRGRVGADGARVGWIDGRFGNSDVFTCVLDAESGTCDGHALEPHPGNQAEMDFEGDTFVWSDSRNGLFQILACEAGSCVPRALELGTGSAFAPALAGDLLAWTDFTGFDARLVLCDLDPDTGTCRGRVEIDTPEFVTAVLDDGRMVWADRSERGDFDVFFCAWDALAKECPIQRLTREPSNQADPDLDFPRVVWSDSRTGTSQIYVLELPSLDPIGERSVAEGRWLRIPLSARDPLGEPPALSATLLDGTPVEELGAVFDDFGDGTGELRWRPGFDRAGEYAVRVRARTVGDLEAAESFRIRVTDVDRRPRLVLKRVHVARAGRPLVLSACQSFDPEGAPLAFRWETPGGQALGSECSLRVEGGSPGVEVYRVTISDGGRERVGFAIVLRLSFPFFALLP